ncbi:hypothetical protein JCM19297_3386 [Nonlabens ulvanivorans]|nr:hypothetical protein [Nonlabens ulvanivorans]GAK88862.1 hypothetical protein JCM19297_3386 [Nonlabens ulvanivorans]
MSRIFISCDEASILSTRDQYNDLSPKEKFRQKLHHGHCLGCRSFDKKSRLFSRTINSLGWVKLSKSQKNSIKQKLKDAMKN